MAKIMSLKDVNNSLGACMATDTAREKVIIAWLVIGKVYQFKQWNAGLYNFNKVEEEDFYGSVELLSNYGMEEVQQDSPQYSDSDRKPVTNYSIISTI